LHHEKFNKGIILNVVFTKPPKSTTLQRHSLFQVNVYWFNPKMPSAWKTTVVNGERRWSEEMGRWSYKFSDTFFGGITLLEDVECLE